MNSVAIENLPQGIQAGRTPMRIRNGYRDYRWGGHLLSDLSLIVLNDNR